MSGMPPGIRHIAGSQIDRKTDHGTKRLKKRIDRLRREDPIRDVKRRNITEKTDDIYAWIRIRSSVLFHFGNHSQLLLIQTNVMRILFYLHD